jgi:hypothetical protein
MSDVDEGPAGSAGLEESSTGFPAGMCRGRGHVLAYRNPAMVARFGGTSVGMPIREAVPDLPAEAFGLLDTVLVAGKPLARWIRFGGERWRMTAVPRTDPVTGEVYGVSFHLRPGPEAGARENRPSL